MRVSAEVAPTSSSWLVVLASILAQDTACDNMHKHSHPRPLLSLTNVAVVRTYSCIYHLGEVAKLLGDGYVRSVRLYICSLVYYDKIRNRLHLIAGSHLQYVFTGRPAYLFNPLLFYLVRKVWRRYFSPFATMLAMSQPMRI
jgi:hypothetical protein